MTLSDLATIVVIGLVVCVGAGTIHQTSSDMNRDYERAEQWCDEHDGELVNVMSFAHGGLHCNLSNGTSVRMKDVLEEAPGQ